MRQSKPARLLIVRPVRFYEVLEHTDKAKADPFSVDLVFCEILFKINLKLEECNNLVAVLDFEYDEAKERRKLYSLVSYKDQDGDEF